MPFWVFQATLFMRFMHGGSEEVPCFRSGHPGFFALCRRRSFKISILRAFVVDVFYPKSQGRRFQSTSSQA